MPVARRNIGCHFKSKWLNARAQVSDSGSWEPLVLIIFFRQVVVGWIHFSSYGLKVGEIYIDYIGKI
jgi:hypothetical protein